MIQALKLHTLNLQLLHGTQLISSSIWIITMIMILVYFCEYLQIFYFNLHNNCLMKYDHLCFTGKKTQDREVESLTSSHRAKRQGEGRCRQTGLKLCSVPRVTLSFAGVEDCGIISLNDWSNLMTWGPVLFPFYGCKNWLQKLKWLAPGHTASR